MKRRAGQVGERLGRELLAPAFTALGDAGAAGASDRPLLRGEARDVRGARRRAPRHPGAAPGRVLGVRLRGGCAGHEAPGLLPPRDRGADGGGPDRGAALRPRPGPRHAVPRGDVGPARSIARRRTSAAAPACARSSRAAPWARSACSAWARRRSTWSRRRRPASRGAWSPSTAPASSPGRSGSSAPTATSTTTRSRRWCCWRPGCSGAAPPVRGHVPSLPSTPA